MSVQRDESVEIKAAKRPQPQDIELMIKDFVDELMYAPATESSVLAFLRTVGEGRKPNPVNEEEILEYSEWLLSERTECLCESLIDPWNTFVGLRPVFSHIEERVLSIVFDPIDRTWGGDGMAGRLEDAIREARADPDFGKLGEEGLLWLRDVDRAVVDHRGAFRSGADELIEFVFGQTQ